MCIQTNTNTGKGLFLFPEFESQGYFFWADGKDDRSGVLDSPNSVPDISSGNPRYEDFSSEKRAIFCEILTKGRIDSSMKKICFVLFTQKCSNINKFYHENGGKKPVFH